MTPTGALYPWICYNDCKHLFCFMESTQVTINPSAHERSRSRPAPTRRPRRTFWARLRLALLICGGLLLLGVGFFYWQVQRLAAVITVADARPTVAQTSPLLGANILLIGTDERSGQPQEGVRSDTLILVRLDALGRWVALLSIPRDSEVALPQLGLTQTKINAAYGQGYAAAAQLYGAETTPPQGGMALSAEVVEALLQLDARGMAVNYTATVNFGGFAQIIDALGGITVDVPRYLRDDAYPTEDYGTRLVEFQPGPQRMDGATALIYARTRHPDSDFGRAARQQQVVQALLHELQAKGPLGQLVTLPALLDALGSDTAGARPVLTTMPLARLDVLFGLMLLGAGLDPSALGQFALGPEQIAYTNGTNLIYEPAAVQTLLSQWQRPPNAADERAIVQVLNATNTSGLARNVSLDLEGDGFTLLPAGNAELSAQTRLYHLGSTPATARLLARQLGVELLHAPPPVGAAPEATLVLVLGADWAR
ncbi:MAG: LytR family transcriptional regulator [Candidatus Viridilinea halotolerans]|uniref:LytR family transcriptional regulator n=1 Tax=Candidatus Viridilinea halotolerans TaxID=2491704 RepID=A0A426U3B3_9CHLR|nr:MAG: LytR family transcriptional regulator [Candidatus Viridilinea halotolerans]